MYPNPHPSGCVWHQVAQSLGAPNLKWCEATQCSWISEPANTWSNLGYLLVGLMVWSQCWRSPQRDLRALGPLLVLMGLLSGLYHASNLYPTQLLDFLGMFLLIFWLLAINLRRMGWLAPQTQSAAWLVMVLAGLMLVHAMYLAHWRFQWLIALAALAIVASEFVARCRPDQRVALRDFWLGLLLLALAQLASLADLTRLACDPQHPWLHGHALWHALSALSLYFSAQHYRRLPLT